MKIEIYWPFSRTSSILCALAALHALYVLIAWIATFVYDMPIVSARVWVVIAWLWIGWVFVLAFRTRKDGKLIVITLAVCAAMFLPTVSTIYSFTVWAINDFAP